jgi:hypothetical protein
MNKFNNSKIYKITTPLSNLIYIGSTREKIERRLQLHKAQYKIYKNGGSRKVMVYNLLDLGIENIEIELIENYICNSLYELHKRERYYIELNKDISINKCIPTRTVKEYYELNKKVIYEKKKNKKLNNQASLSQTLER